MNLNKKKYNFILKNRKLKAIMQKFIGIQEYEYPFISTYDYNFTPYTDEDIIIPFYITDYYQKEWLLNDHSLIFDIEYGIHGKEKKYITQLKAGDHTINLGKLPVGEYRIILQANDRGIKSHKLYIPILVKDKNKIKNMYIMKEEDLVTYSINNQNSELEKDLNNTRLGLIKIINDKSTEGYDGLILLNGYYRINKDSTADDTGVSADDVYISIPSNFTLDLNGSTIKHHVFEGQGTVILRYKKECTDSHIINGTLIGDYGEHSMEINPDTGYTWGEHAGSVNLSRGNFCTLENMTIRDIQGYSIGFGSGADLTYQPFSGGTKGIKLVNGEEIIDEKYTVSNMVEIYTKGRISSKDRWLSIGGYGGVNYLKGDSWVIKISLYDKNKNFLYEEIGYQYRDFYIPENAIYARVTFLGDATDSLNNNTCGIVSVHHSICNSIINVASIHTRTCAMNPTGSYLLVKNCTFEDCATQTTPITIDAEDGWGFMYDMYYIGNKIISDAAGTTGNLLVCYGNNNVLKDNKNFKVIMRRGTQRLYVNNHIGGSIRRDLYPKNSYAFSCYDNILNSNFSMYSDNEDIKTHEKVINNCTITDTLNIVNPNDIFIYCTFNSLPSCKAINSTFNISSIVNSNQYNNGKVKIYSSEFNSKDEDKTLRYAIGLRQGHGKDTYFYNCIFNDKCKIYPHGGSLLSVEFNKCTFNDAYVLLSPTDAQNGDKVIFKDCDITFSDNSFLQYDGAAYTLGYNHILEFENCNFECLNSLCTYLIYLYSYPSGSCTFKNCTFKGCENLNIIDVRHYKMDSFDSYSVTMIDCDTTTIQTVEKDTFAGKIKIKII